MRNFTLSMLTLILNLTASTLQAAWPQYHLTPLGTSGGEYYFHVRGINEKGQVVGNAYIDNGLRGFLWDENHGMVNLGVLDEENLRSYTEAIAFNNAGQVIGYTGISGNIPFIWDATNGMQEIDGLPSSTVLHDINDSGQVVGRYGRSAQEAFIWDEAQGRVELAALKESLYFTNEAWDINNTGQVAGSCNHQAVFWTTPTSAQTLFPPPTAEGGYSRARAINDSGQVVGNYQLTDGVQDAGAAFFWDPDLGVFDLGFLNEDDGGNSVQAINARGQVVGYFYNRSFPSNNPYLWQRDLGMMALESLLDDSENGWRLEQALDINDQGQIVGIGIGPNGRQAFILTPVPEPVTVLLLLTGAAGMLSRRYRRV